MALLMKRWNTGRTYRPHTPHAQRARIVETNIAARHDVAGDHERRRLRIICRTGSSRNWHRKLPRRGVPRCNTPFHMDGQL